MTGPWSWGFPYSEVWAGPWSWRFPYSEVWAGPWSWGFPYSEVWAAFAVWCVAGCRNNRSLFRWILACRPKPWQLVRRARRRHQSSSRNLPLQKWAKIFKNCKIMCDYLFVIIVNWKLKQQITSCYSCGEPDFFHRWTCQTQLFQRH